MKIVLIQPPGWTVHSPPYNIALLKSILKNSNHQVTCLDLNIELHDQIDQDLRRDYWSSASTGDSWLNREFVLNLLEKHRVFVDKFVSKVINLSPDIIGFTLLNRSVIFASEIAKKIKEKQPKQLIIAGGFSAFRFAGGIDLKKEQAIDALCLGEAEKCFVKLLEIIEKGRKIKFCKGFLYKDQDQGIIDCGEPEIEESLDNLPFADFSDFDVSRYKVLPILTSKGCIYNCSFCYEYIWMKKFRCRSSKSVYTEIIFQLSKYPHTRRFHFNDSLINGNIKMLNQLCDLIIKDNLRISWGGQACIRKEMSKDFLIKLKKAGCDEFSYGVESGSNRILKEMNKNFTAELAEEVIRNSHQAGIRANFNIIVGFPAESESEFRETLNFIKRNSKFAGVVCLNTLDLREGSLLHSNTDRWGIADNNSREWVSVDGKNNYQERLRRLEICRNAINKDSVYI